MFSRKENLYSGSEYHCALLSFVKSENESGNVSLKKGRIIVAFRKAVLLLVIASISAFLYALLLFMMSGSLTSLITFVSVGFLTIVLTGIYAVLPGGTQCIFEHIDEKFNDESLLRLYRHGAPDDVIDEILSSLRHTGEITYSSVYDIFWMCSRTSSGISKQSLLGQRYHLVKQRLRYRALCQEQGV